MMPQWVVNLPWGIYDTLINFVELLILFVPATVAFIHYIVRSVTLYTYNATTDGVTLLIHNRTDRSIFISDVQFIAAANNNFEDPVVSWNNGVLQLKPDEYTEVVVNYKKRSQNKQSFQFLVQYNLGRVKKIRVKV